MNDHGRQAGRVCESDSVEINLVNAIEVNDRGRRSPRIFGLLPFRTRPPQKNVAHRREAAGSADKGVVVSWIDAVSDKKPVVKDGCQPSLPIAHAGNMQRSHLAIATGRRE